VARNGVHLFFIEGPGLYLLKHCFDAVSSRINMTAHKREGLLLFFHVALAHNLRFQNFGLLLGGEGHLCFALFEIVRKNVAVEQGVRLEFNAVAYQYFLAVVWIWTFDYLPPLLIQHFVNFVFPQHPFFQNANQRGFVGHYLRRLRRIRYEALLNVGRFIARAIFGIAYCCIVGIRHRPLEMCAAMRGKLLICKFGASHELHVFGVANAGGVVLIKLRDIFIIEKSPRPLISRLHSHRRKLYGLFHFPVALCALQQLDIHLLYGLEHLALVLKFFRC